MYRLLAYNSSKQSKAKQSKAKALTPLAALSFYQCEIYSTCSTAHPAVSSCLVVAKSFFFKVSSLPMCRPDRWHDLVHSLIQRYIYMAVSYLFGKLKGYLITALGLPIRFSINFGQKSNLGPFWTKSIFLVIHI